MLSIVLVMVCGILLGFLVVSRDKSGKVLRVVGRVQQVATILLLFAMGFWLGGNPEFWENIRITGLHGLLFAVATIIGSVLAMRVTGKLLREKEGH